MKNAFHILRYGTHADQKFFEKGNGTYTTIAINGNMVAHSPSAIASFISNMSLQNPKLTYFIDPITHPDYCYYDYSLDGLRPSIFVKSNKNYNIKLLKLHGSINWVHCNNCGRVYTSFNADIGLMAITNTFVLPIEPPCPYCRERKREFSLSPLIITPTLLKDFSCLQIMNIWNNAFIDLSEATEVIFIGYSLPLADFEFRYILKRSLNPSVRIKVVLINKDSPNYYNDLLTGITDRNKSEVLFNKISWNLSTQRYKDFFANHPLKFIYDGLDKALDDGEI